MGYAAPSVAVLGVPRPRVVAGGREWQGLSPAFASTRPRLPLWHLARPHGGFASPRPPRWQEMKTALETRPILYTSDPAEETYKQQAGPAALQTRRRE